MNSPIKEIRVRRYLWYEPAARNADGTEVPAFARITVQAFREDGGPATCVYEEKSVEAAMERAAALNHLPSFGQGVPIIFADEVREGRDAYRRHGIEIPEV